MITSIKGKGRQSEKKFFKWKKKWRFDLGTVCNLVRWNWCVNPPKDKAQAK